MSDRDLEARLSDLRPPEPREGLRDEVLAVVHAELAAPRLSRFDRWLARRSTWVAAAAVLVAMLTAAVLVDGGHVRRLDAPSARSGPRNPGVSPIHSWKEREAVLACLLNGERCDG